MCPSQTLTSMSPIVRPSVGRRLVTSGGATKSEASRPLAGYVGDATVVEATRLGGRKRKGLAPIAKLAAPRRERKGAGLARSESRIAVLESAQGKNGVFVLRRGLCGEVDVRRRA